jgi:molybdopterin converting factor subunit 1
MIVKVLFFAGAKELVGERQVSLTLPDDATVGDLRSTLVDLYPALGKLIGQCALAVDQQYADDSRLLYHNCEVGCIPPVSGG